MTLLSGSIYHTVCCGRAKPGSMIHEARTQSYPLGPSVWHRPAMDREWPIASVRPVCRLETRVAGLDTFSWLTCRLPLWACRTWPCRYISLSLLEPSYILPLIRRLCYLCWCMVKHPAVILPHLSFVRLTRQVGKLFVYMSSRSGAMFASAYNE